MHLKSKNSFWVFLLVVFASCRKSELPVLPYDRGDVIATTIDMNSDYKQQVYFTLSENRVISSNVKTVWDLAFESDGMHVRLNGAKFMSVYNTLRSDYSFVTDTLGFASAKKYDAPSGNLDSTAFGNWQEKTPVYIVDRGFNPSGQHLGYKKLQIGFVNEKYYTVVYGDIKSTNPQQAIIYKDADKNFAYFSFDTGAVQVEPDHGTYDLIFTQFTHLYKDPFEPYLVLGALLNPYNTQALVIPSKKFEDVSLSDTLVYTISKLQNTIGFDWKTYNFQTSSYEIDAKKCYIIKDKNGFFYKLHFIDFYNDKGLKGYPKLEYKKL